MFWKQLFGEEDIENLLGLCGDVLKLGGHLHAFCSDMQLAEWIKLMKSNMETVTM